MPRFFNFDWRCTSLFPGGSTISSLDVSFCDKIGDQALNHISQGLFHLKSLSLNHCQITDEGLARIAKSLHDLEVLYIGQCNRITDKGLQSLSEYLVNLNAIDLYGCTQISTIGIDTIMKLPELSRMNLELWLVRWCVSNWKPMEMFLGRLIFQFVVSFFKLIFCFVFLVKEKKLFLFFFL